MSGEEAVQSPGSDPDTLDLAGADLEKLSRATPELILNTTTLVLDNNKLQRLDNIHTYQCLEKVKHLSPVTCHLSPVTCHLSHVTCHMSPVQEP